MSQQASGSDDMLEPEPESASPANLGILDYSAQPLIDDYKQQEEK